MDLHARHGVGAVEAEARGHELLVVDASEAISADQHHLVPQELGGHASVQDLAEADVVTVGLEVARRTRVVDQHRTRRVDRRAPGRAERRHAARDLHLWPACECRTEGAHTVRRHAEAVDRRGGAGVLGVAEGLNGQRHAANDAVAVEQQVGRGQDYVRQRLLAGTVVRLPDVGAAEVADGDLIDQAALDCSAVAGVEGACAVGQDHRQLAVDQRVVKRAVFVGGARVWESDVKRDRACPGLFQVLQRLRVKVPRNRETANGRQAGVVDADDHHPVLREAGVVLRREAVLGVDGDVDVAAVRAGVAGQLLGVEPEHDSREHQGDEQRHRRAVRVPVADVAAQDSRRS